MTLHPFVAEAARTARAQRVTSGLVALLCGAICAVAVLTVGGTAAAEAQVLGRVDAAGSRLLVVTDTKDSGLVTPAVVEVLNRFDSVQKAVGIGGPVDVSNGDITGGGGRRHQCGRCRGHCPLR